MPTAEARTLTISIDAPVQRVYAFVRDAEHLPRWVAFCKAVRREGDGWILTTDGGSMTLRFVDDNTLGVLDHVVSTTDAEVHVPMRVVANGSGSEVLFTVFRAPAMTDEQLAADVALVERDLRSLKRLLEGEPV